MKHFRITIQLRSLQLTPWQADTLFGSLCWALQHRQGDRALEAFLEPFKAGDPPFLLSDGFPSGYLPLPYILRLGAVSPQDEEAYRKQKVLKKVAFLPEAEFAKACQNQAAAIDEQAKSLINPVSQLHASINRVTGTTATREEGASLFQLNGWAPNAESPHLDLYVAERHAGAGQHVFDLLRELEQSGYGKRKSSGMGHFQISGDPQAWTPPGVQPSNGFVSLSGFVPKKGDPHRGFWQYRVKHGKLGDRFAVGGHPFKIPWIVLLAGATFLAENGPQDHYGTMLEGVSPQYPKVVQYGLAYPIPLRFPDHLVSCA